MASMEKNKKDKEFSHGVGELVLVKWGDGMVYFAKIKRVDWRKRQCVVIFDDKSTDKASFSQIHSVDETTTDIICIKCKRDNSEFPNEIVLCDGCGIGFHQKCHSPTIPASAIELDNPWKCVYCQKNIKNPYLTESIDAMQSLFDENNHDDEIEPMSSSSNKIQELTSVKQEVILDEEDVTTFFQPKFSQSFPRKRKDKHDRAKSHTKKRPLQILKRKFTRSGIGHRTSYSRSHRRNHETDKQDKLNELDNTDETTQSVLEDSVEKNEADSDDMDTSGDSGNESSSSEDDIASKSNKDLYQPHKKRPRCLRVSLTLPPSVETTPVSNKVVAPHIDDITMETDKEITESAPAESVLQSVQGGNNNTMELDTAPLKPTPNHTPKKEPYFSKIAITPGTTTETLVTPVSQSITLSTAVDEDSLVKISPGVTQLKPAKRKRPLTLNPSKALITSQTSLSPLDRLRHELLVSKRSDPLNSSSPCKIQKSIGTTLMQSTGTITSALPIRSKTQTLHSRKSAVPSRTISQSVSLMTSLHSEKTNCIVISPSPSPPPLQHDEAASSSISNTCLHQTKVPIMSNRVATKSKETMTAGYTSKIPSLRQTNPFKEYVFNGTSMQVQTSYDQGRHDIANGSQIHSNTLSHQPKPCLLQHKEVPVCMQQYSACYNSLSNPNARSQSQSMYRQVQYTDSQHVIPQQHNRNVLLPVAPRTVLSQKSVEQSEIYPVVSTNEVAHGYIPTSQTTYCIDSVSTVRSPTGMAERVSVDQRNGCIVYNATTRVFSTPCYSMIDVPTSAACTVVRQPPICTTKPYAVVNAIPITQSTAFKQMTPPMPRYNPSASFQRNVDNNKGTAIDTITSYLSHREHQRRNLSAATTTQKQIQDIARIREEATSDLTQRLHSFSNKYKDFDTLTADDLMEIFHRALKKFQGNSRMYNSCPQKTSVNKRMTPNVNTIESHQVHHDMNKTPVVFVSEPSLPKYLMCQSDQTDSMPKSNRQYQIQTSGVFIPPAESNSESSGSSQQCYNTSHSSQYNHNTSGGFIKSLDSSYSKNGNNKNVQMSITPFTQTNTVVVNTIPRTPIVEKRRRKPDNVNHIKTMFTNTTKSVQIENSAEKAVDFDSIRACSCCGKHATFLCSGCQKLWYCGRDCQVKSWDQHATSCKH